MATPRTLAAYRRLRDFGATPEPAGNDAGGAPRRRSDSLKFVVQKHAARRLHYDFRLELDGTLKSWAVPKGPSLDPADKRMAVQVEDHPLTYADFEGDIPPGHYGAGHVIVWDRGEWTPRGDPRAGYRAGKLEFELKGAKLRGRWALVRMRRRDGERQDAWLLMKERDAHAHPAARFNVVEAQPDSVLGTVSEAPPSQAAPRRALPAHLAPQLATLVDTPPSGGDWLCEIKFDGYRLLTRAQGRSVRCDTRNGKDWSHKLPHLVAAIKALKLRASWLDGEIVVADAHGVPDFQALQNAFESEQTGRIEYMLFDLPFHEGRDLRDLPLEVRRDQLRTLLAAAPHPALRFSEAFDQDPSSLLESARRAGLEGLIGKRRGSPYRSQRSSDWIKLKTGQRQEFIIVGFTEPRGSRQGIGSLLLGVHDDDGALRYVGNVGTGFDQRTLALLRKRLDALVIPHAATTKAPGRVSQRGGGSAPRWVKPELMAEVAFAQWTRDGRVRHAVFHGLRNDRPKSRVTRERAVPVADRAAAAAASASAPVRAGSVRVTHPERVIDAQSGVTKGELVAYCEAVSSLMLPHLRARPVALLRAPAGVGGASFFQKHADATELPGVTLLDPALDPGHEPLFAIASRRGFQSAAQANAVEFHTWNATARAIDRPDRIVFDLDPGQGVAWREVQQAAHLLHGFLGELGLTGFAKTSGGKGLHIVVPIRPHHDWDVVKAFARAVVVHMATVVPARFVSKSGPRNRVGKIYIDYLRNGFGATTVCAWSARARPGLGVSVPVAWDELDAVSGAAHWTVRNVASRLAVGNAPWSAYAATRHGLAAAMKKLGFDPTATAP